MLISSNHLPRSGVARRTSHLCIAKHFYSAMTRRGTKRYFAAVLPTVSFEEQCQSETVRLTPSQKHQILARFALRAQSAAYARECFQLGAVAIQLTHIDAAT